MTIRIGGSFDRFERSHVLLDEEGIDGSPPAALDYESCDQCNFPWILHPTRYDPEEKAMLRFCSQFPVGPNRDIEGCIAP